MKIQLQALGTALANSLMFFIHATAFGYGSVLIKNKEINPIYVFRSVTRGDRSNVCTRLFQGFRGHYLWRHECWTVSVRQRKDLSALLCFDRSTAMIPDYKKGKASAIRILSLNQRKSKIDPENNDGVVLVRGVLPPLSYTLY